VGIRFSVLGEVQAWRCGEEVQLGGPQQRALLGLLLLREGMPVSLDDLIDQMWARNPPASARVTVRTYVSRLRRSFGQEDGEGSILSTAGGYRIPIGTNDMLDLDVFRRQFEEAQGARAAGNTELAAALLRQALSLWQGPALAGAHGDFVEHERARLEQVRLSALEEQISLDLELGRHNDLVPDLTGLVKAYPMRERMHELLMLGLYRAGRQADALRAYQHIRLLLNDELGIDPGPGLQTLHQQILQSAPGLLPSITPPNSPPPASACPNTASSPDTQVQTEPISNTQAQGEQMVPPTTTCPQPAWRPAQLETDIPDFVGRDLDIAWITDIVERTVQPNIAGLTGLEGIGKTALALHTAHLLRDRFPDGQLHADLGAGTGRPANPFVILGRFLRALGVPLTELPEMLEERASLWRTVLDQRRVLIMLDDAESSDQVRHLLPPRSGSAALITSPRSMPELPAVSWRKLTAMTPPDAVGLLTAIIGRERYDNEPQTCDRLLAGSSYHPLAIRLLSARILTKANWTMACITQQICDDVFQLPGGSLHEDGKAVGRSIWRAERRLGENARQAFRLASIAEVTVWCPDSASAALSVSRVFAIAAFDALIDAHLVEPLPDGCYEFPKLVRLVTWSQARAAGQGAACDGARERLCRFYLQTERNARRAINTQPPLPRKGVNDFADGMSFNDSDTARQWLARTSPDRAAAMKRLLDHLSDPSQRTPRDTLTTAAKFAALRALEAS